jgi:hypothetical protein
MGLAAYNQFVEGATTCHPVRLLWASENLFGFRDLREGEGRGGGFLHPSPRYSKLIAFDFAPPPPTRASHRHLAAVWSYITFNKQVFCQRLCGALA